MMTQQKAFARALHGSVLGQGRCGLAGEEGLEPSHAGIKIRCLDQLGYSPTQDTRRKRRTTLYFIAQRPNG